MAAPITEIIDIFRDILRDRDLELLPSMRFDDVAGWDSMVLATSAFPPVWATNELPTLSGAAPLAVGIST